MADVINFPLSGERDWRKTLTMLRDTFKDVPDGTETLEECLPALKKYWEQIFEEFIIQTKFEIPGPMTDDQTVAIRAAVNASMNKISERITEERTRQFMMLVRCEWKHTYYRRTGLMI